MPIYGFECDNCGHQFDRLQKLSDADPSACPQCGTPGIRRQLTAPAFRLAGSGWYETDFKKDGDHKRNLAHTTAGKVNGADAAAKPAADKPVADKPAVDKPGSGKSATSKPAAAPPTSGAKSASTAD